jgi:hypothetical protein
MWIRSSRCLSPPSSWRKIVESQRGTPGSLAIVFRRRSAAGGSARPAPHGDSVGPPSGWSGAKSGSSDRHRQLPTGTKRCSSRYGCDWSKSPRARPNSGLPTDSAERAGEHGDSLARREASRSAKGRKSCHSATRSSYRRQQDQPGLNERAAGRHRRPGFGNTPAHFIDVPAGMSSGSSGVAPPTGAQQHTPGSRRRPLRHTPPRIASSAQTGWIDQFDPGVKPPCR